MARLVPRTAIAMILLLAGLGIFAARATAGAEAGADAGHQSEPASGERGFLAGLISSLLSSDDATVSIGAVEGALSADATVRDIVIADRQGPWFHLDRARLIWNRSALFSRRLEIETLEIGKIELTRQPVATKRVAHAATASVGSLLPELPLKILVKKFSLAELTLGEAVLGTAARLTALGEVALGKPSDGLRLSFQAQRLDAPGHAVMRLSFVPETQALEVSAQVDEPAHGLLAKAARLPGEPPIQFDLAGSGSLDAFVAKLSLDGGAALGAAGTAELQREGSARRLRLALEARLAAVLPPVLAALFPEATHLDGDLRFADDGAFALTRLALTTASARLEAAATVDANHITNLHVTAELPDLSRFASLKGRLLGRSVSRLALEAAIEDLTGALNATVTLTGDIDRKPATGGLRVHRLPDGALMVEDLNLKIGSVTAKGAATIAPDDTIVGTLAVVAGNLDDLSPLLLTRVAGVLSADIKLAVEDGRQVVSVKTRGADLRAADIAVAQFESHAVVKAPLAQPEINAAFSADGITAAGERMSKLRLTAIGQAGVIDLAASARVHGLDVETRGRLTTGEKLRVELASASARRGNHRVALAGPASFTLADGEVDISGLEILVDRGRVGIQGRVGRSLDLTAKVHAVPLAVSAMVAPGLGLSGTLDGEISLSGSVEAPQGRYRMTVSQVEFAQFKAAGAPPLNLTLAGALRGQAADIDATLAAGQGTLVRVKGSLPLSRRGTLDLTVKGTLDAALADARLAEGGRRLWGRVAVDVRATGAPEHPALTGTVTLAEGGYSDALAGTRLDKLRAHLTVHGMELIIDSASATTPNGGTLAVGGQVRLDPIAGFPGSIRVEGRNAALFDDGITAVVADLALTLTGPLTKQPRIFGKIDTVSVDVNVAERQPAALKPLAGTRHLHAPPAVTERLSRAARKAEAQRARQLRTPVFKALLDIAVSSPGRVFVHGHGLNAELGGDLTITGDSDQPKIVGSYASVRGRLDVLGTRLDFSRGRMTFSGDLMPELDFLAETKAGDVTVQVAVTGPATQPEFAFTSQPSLPQDEVLSYLLFSKTTATLSPFQALHLAQAVAQFSGAGGEGTFERLRRSLGLDSLDIRADSGGASAGISRAISDRVTIGIKAGATPGQSGISAEIGLTRNLRLKNEVDSRGSSSIGLGAEWQY